MNRTFPAAAMTAAALLLLVGCTGDAEPDTAATAATAEDESTGQSQDAPGDDGQSVEDACAVIAQTITDATAEFEGGDADDLAAVAEAMEAAAAELATEAGAITNDEVAALWRRSAPASRRPARPSRSSARAERFSADRDQSVARPHPASFTMDERAEQAGGSA